MPGSGMYRPTSRIAALQSCLVLFTNTHASGIVNARASFQNISFSARCSQCNIPHITSLQHAQQQLQPLATGLPAPHAVIHKRWTLQKLPQVCLHLTQSYTSGGRYRNCHRSACTSHGHTQAVDATETATVLTQVLRGLWHWPCITFLERLVIDPAEATVTVDCSEHVEVVITAMMRDAACGAPQQLTLLVVTATATFVAVRRAMLQQWQPELLHHLPSNIIRQAASYGL